MQLKKILICMILCYIPVHVTIQHYEYTFCLFQMYFHASQKVTILFKAWAVDSVGGR